MSTPQEVQELFTWASLATLQGAVGATFIATNVIGSLFGRRFDPARKWVAFVFALALELAIAWYAAGDDDFKKWFIAVMNGFLVYASAVGLNTGATMLFGARGSAGGFLRPWF